MKVSKRIGIYFDKLEDWEIKRLIEVCQDELARRQGEAVQEGRAA